MKRFSIGQYKDIIIERKFEAQREGKLYIEVNCKDLMREIEHDTKNSVACSKALYDCLLEGDCILVEPKTKTKCGGDLTVRFYVDNLDPSRRKYSECN